MHPPVAEKTDSSVPVTGQSAAISRSGADGYANAAEAALERAKDCPIAQQKKED